MKQLTLLYSILVLLLCSLPGMGQTVGSSQDIHAYDTIDLASLNITVNVPVVSRGGPVKDELSWVSSFFITLNGGSFQPHYNNLTSVYSAYPFFGVAWAKVTSSVSCGLVNGVQHYSDKDSQAYLQENALVSSQGPTHPLPTSWYRYESPGGTCVNPTSQAGYAGDNSGIYVDSVAGTETPSNGHVFSRSGETDPNGNIANQVTTSLGQPFVTVGSGSITYKDASGANQPFGTTTSTPYIRSNWGCGGDYNIGTGFGPALSAITFPDSTALGFSYEPTAGYAGEYTGRLASLALPTGGTISYTYSGGDAPGPGTGFYCEGDLKFNGATTPVLTRTLSDGSAWTYTTHFSSDNWTHTTTVTDPSGNNVVHTFFSIGSPVEVLTQTYQGGGINCTSGCTSANLLKTVTYCYNNLTTFANCAISTANPINYPQAPTFPTGTVVITEEDVYTTLKGISGSSEVATTFDTYGNVTATKKYDFGSASPTVISTITYGSYNSGCVPIGNNIVNKPCEMTTSDGTHTSTDIRFTYDSRGSLLSKGALVGGTTWLTSSATYNSNGTVNVATDTNGTQTTYGYAGTGSCSNGNGGLLPTSETVGGLLIASTQYDCMGGVVKAVSNANGAAISKSFTANGADHFYRVKSMTGPLGDTVTLTYGPTSTESSLSFGSSVVEKHSFVDALGRSYASQVKHGSSYDTVSLTTGWSTSGYQTFVASVPCSQSLGTACSGTTTSTKFDALGRITSKADPYGATATYTYTGPDAFVKLIPITSGENAKQSQTEYDGLGRVTSTCAIMSSGGAGCGQANGGYSGVLTTFTYSMLNAGAKMVSTRGGQSHTTVADGLGRTVSETTPEIGTVTYVYDTASATCFNIASAGDLVEVIDNAGVHSCYGYDSLHRLTGWEATTSGAATNCPGYVYGDDSYTPPTGVTIANGKGRIVEAYISATCTGDKAVDEWFSYDAEGRLTDVWESTPHSGGYYHTSATYSLNGQVLTLSGIPGYPTVTYGLDGDGSPNTAVEGTASLVSGVTKGTFGQPLTIAVGAAGGDTDTYGYDEVGRMSSWTFTIGATPASQTGTLYRNGNGTLQQLIISDGFNGGGAQSCTFGYDDLVRVVADNCGSVWSQTLSYDQFDNVTKAGSSSWNPGYNSANNRYSTIGATYDANGRLTYDSLNHYTWNLYGQLASVVSSGTPTCGTSGTCFTYDAFGRMVEKSVGSTYYEMLYSPIGKTAQLSGATTVNYSYIPLPGGATVYLTGSGGGARYFQHKDWTGSVRLSSSVQNRGIYYDRAFAPFGEMYDNFGANTVLVFEGLTQDAAPSNGLYDGAAEYHAGEGRYIAPAGNGWNPYAK